MKRSLVVLSLLTLLALLAFLSLSPTSPSVSFPSGATVNVELALTASEQARGLSGRASLGTQEGMLFLHADRRVRYYWMKDMLIPIDIIWIDGDIVGGFSQNVPIEEPPYQLYSSVVPVDKVLEVQAGFVQKNNVNVGDVLDIRLPQQ